MESFTEEVVQVIRSIPYGKAMSYGQVAALAGNPRAARQVVRVLHTMSRKEKLPWHRVVNRKGEIRLPHGQGFEEQKAYLEAEGIEVDSKGRVDLSHYGV
ncbi:MGMT family protein [Gottschalkiaceae bacterium SANA]|nr:MGMT family protein [Gottschalkiaceae bacterium SANA]